MQKGQSDQSLEIKKRARRRLVGAIALVLLMIIILPMLLEDRDINGTNESVEIIMPDQDGEETATVGLDEQLADVAPMPDTSADMQETESSAVKEVKIDTDQPKAVPTPKVEAKVEKVATPEKSKTTTITPKPKSTSSNQYYVQIGVFSNTSNIAKLQTKLDGLGYDSYTEKMTKDGSVKTRLRTKSFDSRNEAAIALENIKDAGLAGMVVSEK